MNEIRQGVPEAGEVITNVGSEYFSEEDKEEILEHLTEEEKNYYDVNTPDMILLKRYEEYNNEVQAIIQIEDTIMNHPVMQSFDDEGFYLYHDLDRNYNPHGVPFLTLDSDLYRDRGNIVIFGHNIRAHDRDVFCDLEFLEDIDYYKEHPVITLITDKGTAKYLIFAYYLVDTSDEDAFVYWEDEIWGSKANFERYMDEVEARNWYQTDIPYDYDDQFLTLSSCSVELAHSGTNKMIVMARRLEVDEDYEEYIKNASMRENPLLPKKLTKDE